MKKTVRIETFRTSDCYGEEWTIEEFEGILYNSKQDGATNISIDVRTEWESGQADLTIWFEREETDVEYQDRLAEEAEYKRIDRIRKLETLERLKKDLGVV